MKRFIALLLSLAMMLALVACGNNGNNSQNNPGTNNPDQGATGDTGTPDPGPSDADLTETQKIIKEAQGMTLDCLLYTSDAADE